MPNAADMQIVNSLSYADVAGLQLGLLRLPGEETTAYVDRLYRAVVSKRDHSYEGMLDELALELGLKSSIGMTLSFADPAAVVSFGPGLITLTSLGETHKVPTATIDGDDYLVWRKLGEVAADLEKIPGVLVTLKADENIPALQIARQGNVFVVINEPINERIHAFAHKGFIADSVRLNKPVGSISLGDTTIEFIDKYPAGLTVSYQYLENAYDVVLSQVGLFGLQESSLSQIALSADGVLAYQIREFIQTVMKNDRSYWTK